MQCMRNASDATTPTTKTWTNSSRRSSRSKGGIANKHEAIASRNATIRLRVEQVHLPKHEFFGRLSERLNPDQLAMLF